MSDFKVYIPKESSRLTAVIAKGSGIVSCTEEYIPGHVKIFYEGNLYGAENLETFEDKLYIASSRAVANYPTIAKMMVPLDQLVCIGEYNFTDKKFKLNSECVDVLDQWSTS